DGFDRRRLDVPDRAEVSLRDAGIVQVFPYHVAHAADRLRDADSPAGSVAAASRLRHFHQNFLPPSASRFSRRWSARCWLYASFSTTAPARSRPIAPAVSKMRMSASAN